MDEGSIPHGTFQRRPDDGSHAHPVSVAVLLERIMQIRRKVDFYPPARPDSAGGSFGVVSLVLWLPAHADLPFCPGVALWRSRILNRGPPCGMVATEHEPRLVFRGRLRLIFADIASGLFSEYRQVQTLSF